MVDGKIRINRTNPTDFTDLHDYRLFNMHDALNGTISKILNTYNGENLLTVGYDGNLFLYKWNGPRVVTDESTKLAHIPEPIEYYDIDYPEKHPSLEQQKIFAEIKRQEEAAAAHDRKVLSLIGDLQAKFMNIEKENEKLHCALKMKHHEMLLDNRVTQQIRDELQAELDDVRDDLAYDLEFAQVGKNKLYNYFLKSLDHIPIKVMCLRW